MNFDELYTLLVEVEFVINSRPLTHVNDDTEGTSYALCPSDLVNGRRLSATPNEAHYEVMKEVIMRSGHDSL